MTQGKKECLFFNISFIYQNYIKRLATQCFLSVTNWEQESVLDFGLLEAKHGQQNGHWSVSNKYNDVHWTIELSRLLFDNFLMIKTGHGIS